MLADYAANKRFPIKGFSTNRRVIIRRRIKERINKSLLTFSDDLLHWTRCSKSSHRSASIIKLLQGFQCKPNAHAFRPLALVEVCRKDSNSTEKKPSTADSTFKFINVLAITKFGSSKLFAPSYVELHQLDAIATKFVNVFWTLLVVAIPSNEEWRLFNQRSELNFQVKPSKAAPRGRLRGLFV